MNKTISIRDIMNSCHYAKYLLIVDGYKAFDWYISTMSQAYIPFQWQLFCEYWADINKYPLCIQSSLN